MKLRILSAGAVKGLIDALGDSFERDSGASLELHYRAVGAIGEAMARGEHFDVIISSSIQIAEHAEKGLLNAGTIGRIGSVHTAVAVPAGQRHPDISSGSALIETLKGASEIYHPDMARGTAGVHLMRILEQTGLRAQLESRLRAFENGASTMQNLADGKEKALGLAQATEILYSKGVEYVGPLPKAFELSTPYSVAASSHTTSPVPVEELIRLLVSPEAKELRLTCGFE